MKVGIIGLGYWGPNLVRNFSALNSIDKIIACDLNEERLKLFKHKFPEVEFTKDYSNILKPDLDAVAIATPVDSHYKIAKEMLEAGKHIWVEKPFTLSSAQAVELLNLARTNKLKIFVDHTFLYTGAVKKIKEIVERGELGDIIYFDSVRINLGLFQHDVNVVWDLAPHDLSIMKYILCDKKVIGVTACGISNYYELENLAQLSLHFEDDSCFAHFHVNWTSPVKIRRIMIAGKKKMLVFDDLENSEKIKIYDCGVDIKSTESLHNALIQYRIGDMYSPKIEQAEALTCAAKEFISCIIERREPLTSGKDGLEIVQILEASEKSLKNKGKLIYLDQNIGDELYKQNIQIHVFV